MDRERERMPRSRKDFLAMLGAKELPLVAIAAVALQGCVHFPRSDEPIELMEPITVGVPVAQGQIVEAHPAIHVVFHNGLDVPDAFEERRLATTVSFSFLAAIRMYDEPSSPVRTPSYAPRLKLQLVGIEPVERKGAQHAHRLLGALELYVGHYSNGQNGCALAGQQRGDGFSDFDCTPLTSPASQELNLQNGSFTTNVLGANVAARWLAFPAAGGVPKLAVTALAGVEWNVPCHFVACMEPEMISRYGEVVLGWRASGDVLVRPVPLLPRPDLDSRLRMSASGKVHVGLGAGRSPFGDAAFEVAWLPRYRRELVVGPFVRYRFGRDDLNIRFEERLDEWTVGALVDVAPPEWLRPRAP